MLCFVSYVLLCYVMFCIVCFSLSALSIFNFLFSYLVWFSLDWVHSFLNWFSFYFVPLLLSLKGCRIRCCIQRWRGRVPHTSCAVEETAWGKIAALNAMRTMLWLTTIWHVTSHEGRAIYLFVLYCSIISSHLFSSLIFSSHLTSSHLFSLHILFTFIKSLPFLAPSIPSNPIPSLSLMITAPILLPRGTSLTRRELRSSRSATHSCTDPVSTV